MPTLKQAICQRENGACRERSLGSPVPPRTAVSVDRAAAMHPVPGRDPGCWPVAAPGSPATAHRPASVGRLRYTARHSGRPGRRKAARNARHPPAFPLLRPGVQCLAGGLCIVGLAGAAQIVEQAARSRAGLQCALHRRLAPRMQPQTEADQRAECQQRCAQLPRPEHGLFGGYSLTAPVVWPLAGEIRIVRNIQRTRLERGALRRSSTVFHQTTSSAGSCNGPLRWGSRFRAVRDCRPGRLR